MDYSRIKGFFYFKRGSDRDSCTVVLCKGSHDEAFFPAQGMCRVCNVRGYREFHRPFAPELCGGFPVFQIDQFPGL